MTTDNDTQLEQHKFYKPKKKSSVFILGLLFFIVAAIIAFIICNFRVQYATQSIMHQQKDIQQTWMDKSLNAIRVWRNELVEQARFISSSELFRLFVLDIQDLSPDEVNSLALPETLHHPDESLRSMAEQLQYLRDLLKDFTRRKAWHDARILLPDGKVIASPDFSLPLAESQKELARKASENSTYVFGPVREDKTGLVMDMAEPLYEVLTSDTPKAVAVLLLTVPMNQPLSTFLARNTEQYDILLPRIVNRDGKDLSMIYSQNGAIKIEPVADSLKNLENLPFGRRLSLNGREEVYSMGGMPTALNWLFVLETPATIVDELVKSQKLQIYGLGLLASIGITLLAAWAWARYTSKKLQVDITYLRYLYNRIDEQKMVLDCINESFQAGVAIVNPYGNILYYNSDFKNLCDIKGDIKSSSTTLLEVLPDSLAIKLMENISLLKELKEPTWLEYTFAPDKTSTGKRRIIRVEIYPYVFKYTDSLDKYTDCMVILIKDVTRFKEEAEEKRRLAEKAKERQVTLITAFQRAVESVDSNLLGQSDRMAALAQLLSEPLELNNTEKETLDTSARLSQIAKIYIPHHLLNKKGKLTPEESEQIKKAYVYADQILHDLRFDVPIQETISEMKQRLTQNDKISLCGRALAVIDSFISMTSPRPWRGDAGLSREEAENILRNDKGYDQNIVEALSSLPKDAVDRIIQRKSA